MQLIFLTKHGSMQTGRHLTLHIDRPTDNFEHEIGYVRERERENGEMERERDLGVYTYY